MSDLELANRAKGGDKAAFEELVRLYEKRLYYAALGILRNESDAQDAVQDSFVNAYRFLKHFKGESSFYTWISSIMINNCRRTFKRKKRWYQVLTGYSDDKNKFGAELVEKWKEKDDNLYLVGKTLEKMDYKDRELLYYVFFEELQYEEIAEILKCAIGTVKSRVFYSKEKFKTAFIIEQKHYKDALNM
ncbi:MAG: hypothetical protein A2231_08540 [Candidatus Firestonebacteria bacterium RIFOXYA2_FULL_40_8]|nr:MAG: hypothetical protein A2231_08540 [Candidatus Firestonebacteria bacterium RIFOXYA2_FULL_40_8]